MPVTILMPALSPTMEKGKLAKWLKKEGDRVKSGDVLAEIETDKATMEIEAIDEGTLGKILVAEGTEDVLVNAPIGVILGDGEKLGEISATAPPPSVFARATPDTSPVKGEDQNKPNPPPVAGEVARSDGGGGQRVFASPLAKRLAKDKGINLSSVKGSGPHGRIVEKDIANYLPSPLAGEGARGADEGKPRAMAQGMSDDAVLKLFDTGSYELIPHDGMRKTIARRLTEAKQTIPHFYVTMDCALENLTNLRERLNMQAPKKDGLPIWKISVNDFIIKALAMALVKVPDANVSWTDSAMVKHKHADIGVAVSIPGGLITPIVRKAETKGLAQISIEMKDFAARARARKLNPSEYTGGSTSVSNLGMMGVKNFAAIVNPPQATILAIGAGERRPIVRGNEIVIEQQMSVTLSTDHRCVDGALGAELLGAFKIYIEEPGLMLV